MSEDNTHIGSVSETTYVEWKIPHFLPLEARPFVFSPAFNSAGWRWYLEVEIGNEYVSVYLWRMDSVTDVSRVTYSIGIKQADGTLEEVHSDTETFDEYTICCVHLKSLDDLQKRQSELVPFGTLTITCRLKVETPSSSEEASPNPSPKSETKHLVDLEALSADFKDLLGSERKCDVTIHVQGREFRAHRAVLMARSSVLRAMYEHDTEEARTGILKIPDSDPDSFNDFLGYLYTGRMGEMSFRTAYHLYSTSDKYDVQRLKSFCSDYLKQNLATENVCDVVLLADRHGDDGLASAAQSFFNENFPRIFLTSEWTDMMKNHLRLANELSREMASAMLLKSP